MRQAPYLLSIYLVTAAHAALPAHAQTPVDKRGFHLFAPTPVAYMRPLIIDGPGATESPYTVDAGHFQIELTFFGYSSYTDLYEGEMYRLDVGIAGPVNLKVGLLNSLDVQLVLEPYKHVVEREGGYYRETRHGFGDTTVRLKYNLWGNDSGRTALAVTPFITFPTSAAGVGNARVEGGLLLPFSVELPWDSYLGLTSGFASAENVLTSGRNAEFRNSVALGRELSWDMEAYVEFFSSVTTERGAGWAGSFDLGLIYWLTDNLQLNAGLNIGLTGWADDWYGFAGMAWRR